MMLPTFLNKEQILDEFGQDMEKFTNFEVQARCDKKIRLYVVRNQS